MKIILVSDFNEIPKEHVLLNALFEEGLTYFHLRKRDYSQEAIIRYLEQISPAFYERVVIHSHFELVEPYCLRGIHFKKNYTIHHFLKDRQLSAEEVRYRYRHISHSVHSLADIKKCSFPFDYLFLSPVFDSISNKGYNSKIKIQTIRKFLREEPTRPEIIALSGITAEKVGDLYTAGFNGLGLLGYIWLHYKENGDVQEAIRRFRLVREQVKALEPAEAGR